MEPNKPQQSSKEFIGFKEEDLIELIEDLKKEGIDIEKERVTRKNIDENDDDILDVFSHSEAFNSFLAKKSKDKFNNTIYQAKYVRNDNQNSPYVVKLASELPENEGVFSVNMREFNSIKESTSRAFFHATPAILQNTIKTDASGSKTIKRKFITLRNDLLPECKELDDTKEEVTKPKYTKPKIQSDYYSCNPMAEDILMHAPKDRRAWYAKQDNGFLLLPQELRYSQSARYAKTMLEEWQKTINDILARTKSKDTATKEKATQEFAELQKAMPFLSEKKIREDIKKYPVKVNLKKIRMIKKHAPETKDTNIVTIDGTEFMTILGYINLKEIGDPSNSNSRIVVKTKKLLKNLVTLIEKRKQQKR